jgi:hypothetical protein
VIRNEAFAPQKVRDLYAETTEPLPGCSFDTARKGLFAFLHDTGQRERGRPPEVSVILNMHKGN